VPPLERAPLRAVAVDALVMAAAVMGRAGGVRSMAPRERTTGGAARLALGLEPEARRGHGARRVAGSVEWLRLAMLKIRNQRRWWDPNRIAHAHVGELVAFAETINDWQADPEHAGDFAHRQ